VVGSRICNHANAQGQQSLKSRKLWETRPQSAQQNYRKQSIKDMTEYQKLRHHPVASGANNNDCGQKKNDAKFGY